MLTSGHLSRLAPMALVAAVCLAAAYSVVKLALLLTMGYPKLAALLAAGLFLLGAVLSLLSMSPRASSQIRAHARRLRLALMTGGRWQEAAAISGLFMAIAPGLWISLDLTMPSARQAGLPFEWGALGGSAVVASIGAVYGITLFARALLSCVRRRRGTM